MTPLQAAAALNRAADYLDSHGLRRYGWGTPGRSVCMNAALAIALDRDPAELSCIGFQRRHGATVEAVGRLVLESGLLDRLPPVRRGDRAGVLTPVLAVRELARWSDAVGRDGAYAASALRRAAVRLLPRAARRAQAEPRPALVTA